ncbi:hypothetical protein [Bradyrhizobium sp. USDA 4341]
MCALLRIDFDQSPKTVLGDRIVLARHHSRRRGEPAQDLLLFRLPLVAPGEAAQLCDHRLKYRVFRRRRIQIVDVADGFEAQAEPREDSDVGIVGVGYLRKNVGRLFPREASFVDNP